VLMIAHKELTGSLIVYSSCDLPAVPRRLRT
jgi:hypothetical protein